MPTKKGQYHDIFVSILGYCLKGMCKKEGCTNENRFFSVRSNRLSVEIRSLLTMIYEDKVPHSYASRAPRKVKNVMRGVT